MNATDIELIEEVPISSSHRTQPVIVLFAVIGVCVLGWCAVNWDSWQIKAQMLVWGSIILSAAWLLSAAYLLQKSIRLQSWAFLSLLSLSIIIRGALLFQPALLSDDVNRYVWDGAVQLSGSSPYSFAPSDSSLSIPLASSSAPFIQQSIDGINHPTFRSIYPPIAQVFFTAGAWLSSFSGDHAVALFKLPWFMAELLTLLLLFHLLRQSGRPKEILFLYAYCPVILIECSLEAHVDFLAFPFLLLAFLFYRKQNFIAVGIFLGFAISVKLLPAVAVVFVLLGSGARWEKLGVALSSAGVVGLSFAPHVYTCGFAPFETLFAYGANWDYNASWFNVFAWIASPASARVWCFVFLIIVILSIGRKPSTIMPLEEKTARCLFVTLLLSPVVFPWYLSWLAVAFILAPRLPYSLWLAIVPLTYLNTLFFITHGRQRWAWEDLNWIWWVEYAIVFGAIAIENARVRFNIQTPKRTVIGEFFFGNNSSRKNEINRQ